MVYYTGNENDRNNNDFPYPYEREIVNWQNKRPFMYAALVDMNLPDGSGSARPVKHGTRL